jgi:Spy/CpxP family protein refolding chaperone
MKYILIFIITFTLATADGHEEQEHYYKKDLSYLKLNQKQVKKVWENLKKYQKELKKYRKLKKKIIHKKQEIFEQEHFDKNKLQGLSRDLNNLQVDIEKEFLDNMHKILTKKQREKFVKYIYEWEVE